ncbi:MAG: mechanosensitive ion channel family protein [Deltaproteobacteria bacterium]|jgi:small-conductance mechanosensitive channel|nr:mechanosensitive ion channel family protein [Deltaproteobacteria bacterium]
MFWLQSPDGQISSKLISTIVFVFFLFALRFFLSSRLTLKNANADIRRRWLVFVRNMVVIIFIMGIAYIWFEQLRAITTTVMVVGVAVVLATRDFFLNITGFFFRTGTNFFTTGERIEVDNIRGDVIDQSLLGVTILEVGPGKTSHIYTGKKIFIPNIKLLKSSVSKEAYLKDYVFHFITVPVKSSDDWGSAQEFLLRAAKETCQPYFDDFKSRTKEIVSKHSLSAPTIEPRITVQLPEPGRINLILRVPLPAKKRGLYEQKILQRYMQQIADMRKESEQRKSQADLAESGSKDDV